MTGPSPNFHDPGLKVVSFDIFDTLIQRACGTPALIFALLEPQAFRLGGPTMAAFQQLRPRLERLARQRRPDPRVEITLEGIYAAFVELGLLSGPQAVKLMEAELALEKSLAIRRESGCALFEAALAAGRRVVLVSDMYMPRAALDGILAGLSIEGHQAVYLSSQRLEMKYYGGLWDLVLKEEAVAAQELLHIGDDAISDVKTASERGIRTFQLPKALENFKKHPANQELYRKGFPDELFPDASIFPALAQGLSAVHFHDAPRGSKEGIFSGLFHLGYAALGPAVSAFALWLARAAAADRTEELFFLSRDGFLLKKVFDELAPAIGPEIRSHYIRTSRKVAVAADLKDRAGIVVAVMSYFKPVTLGRWLDDKFLFRPQALPKSLTEKFGLDLQSDVSMADRDRLLPLCLELAPEIIENSDAKRRALTQYLQEVGFNPAKGQAVVDVGFSARIQEALAAAANTPDLKGYYFFTDYRAARPMMRGLAAESFFEANCDPFSPQFAHKYLYHCYFETFLKDGAEGALDDMLIDYAGRARPVSRPLHSKANASILGAISAGALRFAQDMAKLFGPWLPQMAINPYTACQTYLHFLQNPTAPDAGLIQGLTIDDSFCGSDQNFFLGPENDGASAWREGAEAIFGELKTK